MISVKETKLTDVYGLEHAYLDTVKAGGLVSFYVPAETPNWLDYRAAGDETDGAALTTNTFGHGIMYGAYVDGAKASVYGIDNSLSVLHFTCHDTYGEHTLRRWAAGDGMEGASPLETINLSHSFDPLTNGQESLVWIAADSFLMTALQWDAATQRMMHVVEQYVDGNLREVTIAAQRETYDPMLPPNKITSTDLSAVPHKMYEFKLRGLCATTYWMYADPSYWHPDDTPMEFMLQLSTQSTFETASLVQTYIIPADEGLVDYGMAQAPFSDQGINIYAADCSVANADEGDSNSGLTGAYLYIVRGTGAGQSCLVEGCSSVHHGLVYLRLGHPNLTGTLDDTSAWELRYKQGTKNIAIPTATKYYYRFAQRPTPDDALPMTRYIQYGAWTPGIGCTKYWPGGVEDYFWDHFGVLFDPAWGEERDTAAWLHDLLYYIGGYILPSVLIYRHLPCYVAHTYLGLTSGWRIRVNDKDWGASNWRIQGSVSADFTDDPIPLDETGSFANYLRGCNVIRSDTILDLDVPVAGWYVRARGENADGSIVSEWSEDVYAKAGQSNQSHSYTLYVPSYVGERETHLCDALVATATSGYVLFKRQVNSVLNQAETAEEETLFLLPVSLSGVLGTPVTVATYAWYLNYQPSIFVSGDTVYVAYYVDTTHLYWKSYNTATSTLSAEHTVVLPVGYTELGYGTIWQPGGLLFTAVFDYGPPSIAHLAYVDTAVSDTLQVLTNTHADDGGMQGSSGFGFWYPFVTDYDAYEDYGVAFLSMAQAHSFPWVFKFQLTHKKV